MPLLTAIARPHRRVAPTTDPLNQSVLGPGGLVAWWKADETVGATTMLDYSGNGFHATYNLTASLTQHTTPLRTGSNGSITTTGFTYAAVKSSVSGALASIGLTSGSAYTFIVFAKKIGATTSIQKIFGLGPDSIASEAGPCIGYRTSASNGVYGMEDNSGTLREFSPNATAGTLVMFAWVKNGLTWGLYENGTLALTNTQGTLPGQGYSEVNFMGGTHFPGSTGFIGTASDFMIYNIALGDCVSATSTQLTAIAHAGGLV